MKENFRSDVIIFWFFNFTAENVKMEYDETSYEF